MSAQLSCLVAEVLDGKGLQEGEYPFLLRYGTIMTLKKGRPFVWQDDPVERCALVLSGKILPCKHRMGAQDIILPAISRGDWVCLAEVAVHASAQSDYVTDVETLCLSFSNANLSAIRERPLFEHWVSLCLARHVLCLQSFLKEGGSLQRIVFWILLRRKKISNMDPVKVIVTQSEIARNLGLTRETVNKKLAQLELLGLVTTKRAELGIPDWNALEEYIRDCDQ